MISYETLLADIYTPQRTTRYTYTICSPPPTYPPKGTILLLHDFFKSAYQFRHAIDLFAMAGYITIAPNVPGRTISRTSTSPSSRKINMRTLIAELSQFLHLIDAWRPLHLVGVGFGASIAVELAIQHSEIVASVTCCSDPHFTGGLRHLEHLLRISPSSSGKELSLALQRFFTSTTSLSQDDLAEYIEPFSESGHLLDHQQAAKQILTSQHTLHDSLVDLADLEVNCLLLQPPEKGIFVKGRNIVHENRYLTTKNVNCDPEAHPESFAVAVLGYLHVISMRPC